MKGPVRTLRYFAGLGLLLLVLLCGGIVPAGAETGPDDSYQLQPGDRVAIKIYPEDEFIKGSETEISTEGNITIPLVGRVPVGGKSVAEAEKILAAILDRDYLVDPEVVIEVLEYKTLNFVVLGEVKKPGTYQFPPGKTSLTLLQAISEAGGFSDIANIKKIVIRRKTSGRETVLHANADNIIRGRDPDVQLQAEDIVHVSESLF